MAIDPAATGSSPPVQSTSISPKTLVLVEFDHTLLEQLQQRQEAHDHVESLDQATGETPEGDPPDTWQFVDEFGDRVGHAGPYGRDVEQIDPRHRLGCDGAQVRGVKALAGDALEQVGHQLVEALVGARRARVGAVGVVGQLAEHAGDVLEGLALQQAGQQEVAFLPQRQLIVEVDVVTTGQEPTRFELDERCGDQQELGGDVEIDDLQTFDLGQVGVDDSAQRDVVDVDLLFEDQVEEKVEWPLEDGGCHRKCHTGSG